MNLDQYFDWGKIKEAETDLCRSCDSLEAAIRKCDSLECLFSLWKITHGYEYEAEKTTFPNLSNADVKVCKYAEDFKYSFCPDGYLSDAHKARVLFICRESNISDLIQNDILTPEPFHTEHWKGDFWMRDVVQIKETGAPANCSGSAKGAQTKYYNCLIRLKDSVTKENTSSLSDCAYLNLNKRGGFHTCDQKRLGEYTRRYWSFIRQEIELLVPEHIVICGKLHDPLLRAIPDEIDSFCGHTRCRVYPRHPSRYSNKSIEEFCSS